eukprot:EG_transcript_38527
MFLGRLQFPAGLRSCAPAVLQSPQAFAHLQLAHDSISHLRGCTAAANFGGTLSRWLHFACSICPLWTVCGPMPLSIGHCAELSAPFGRLSPLPASFACPPPRPISFPRPPLPPLSFALVA